MLSVYMYILYIYIYVCVNDDDDDVARINQLKTISIYIKATPLGLNCHSHVVETTSSFSDA